MRAMRYQPQGGARLAMNNPLARGLISVFVGAQAFDPLTGKPFVNTTPNNRTAGTMGIGVDGRLGQAKTYPAGPSLSTGSMFVVISTTDATTEQIIAEIGPDGSFANGVRGLRFVNGQFSAYVRNFYDLLTPGTIPVNKPVPVGVTYSGATTSIYVNGQLAATGTTADTTSTADTFNVGGITGQTSYNLKGTIPIAFAWSRALSAKEMSTLAENPWQMFEVHDEHVETAVATSVSPSNTQIALTGFAPTVVRSANISLAPANAALAITGYAPSITQGLSKTISPAPASMTLTGYAPAVTRGASQTIPAGAAVPSTVKLTGYAPTISQANNVTPHFADYTILQLSGVRGVAALGPARIQQTADLL